MNRANRASISSLAVVVGAALAFGCGSDHTAADAGDDAGSDAGTPTALECVSCHTTSTLSAAHGVHLAGGGASNAFACSECHPLFTSMSHTAGAPVIAFTAGSLARTGGLAPSWNATTATCSSVYCHGGDGTAVTGGKLTSPSWNTTDGSPDRCDSCHGYPPIAKSHVQSPKAFCNVCHADAVLGGTIDPGARLHVNGAVDVLPQSAWGTVGHGTGAPPPGHPSAIDFTACGVCHGPTPIGAAQTRVMSCSACHAASDGGTSDGGTDGGTNDGGTDDGGTVALDCATCHSAGTLSAAHAVHIAGSGASPAFGCSECHTLYTSASHEAGAAVITFATQPGDLAKTGNLSPTWTAATATCSSVYCHGGDGTVLHGGSATSPIWTKADGSQDRCDSCHGNPPAANAHVQCTKDFCFICHAGWQQGGAMKANSKLHLDGKIDVMPMSAWGTVEHGFDFAPPGHVAADFSSCNACHGTPPVGNAPTRTFDCHSCHD